jgi:putative endonuclease
MSRVSGKPYFVYVLWSESGKCFYTGIAEDPQHRLGQHNDSALKHWTARFRPWRLVYQESQPDFTTARRRENELKKQKGGRGFFEKTGLDPCRFPRRA